MMVDDMTVEATTVRMTDSQWYADKVQASFQLAGSLAVRFSRLRLGSTPRLPLEI